MRICDVATMPLDMQPLSKLHSYGSAVLSDSELLNIIFGSRTISRLTIDMIFGQNEIGLSKLGLSRRQRDKIEAVKEFSQRWSRYKVSDKKFIRDTRTVAEYYSFLKEEPIEHAYCMFVNSKGVFIKSEEVSIGSTDSAVMSIREIIRRAIMSNSSGVVLVHNHPSGNFDPSPDDIQLSKRMKEAMEICNLKLVDSIIIGDNGYCSLSERGIL